MGVFARIFVELAQPGAEGETIMRQHAYQGTANGCDLPSPKPYGMVSSTLLFSCQ